MLPGPPLERLSLPAPPAASPRPAFPWVATLAPVAVSIVLWVVTQSVLSLLFALLGPVVAAGGVLDGRRSRRRAARAEHLRFDEGVDRLTARIETAHDRERERCDALVARPATVRWDVDDRRVPVRIGWGVGPPVVELAGGDLDDARYRSVAEAASGVPDCPLVVDAAAGVGVVGPPVLAAAVARMLAVQVAASVSPGRMRLAAPAEEVLGWAGALPHAVTPHGEDAYRWSDDDHAFAIAWAETADGLGAVPVTIVDLGADGHPSAAARDVARADAVALSARAAELGHRPPESVLPGDVAFADLAPSGAVGLAAAVGMAPDGPAVLDLVAQGPHALVAGTTGSGKSELLVTWVLGMARDRTPDEVAFVLIDFKGGSAFAQLAGLPHVCGTLSDLEPRLTRRAVESLRAELRRRERALADAGVRAVDDLPAGALPRLVIVVDEFAAMVADTPDLHDLFADLAARGRSLGMHLILCTQRPAGVVRDAVLANIGVRVALRVTDRADSIAMTGSDAAARLPAEPRGRAVIVDAEGERVVQVAIAGAADIEHIVATKPAGGGVPPWRDPLPTELSLDAVPEVAAGLPVGMRDLPAEQAQPAAVFDPTVDGSLLVLGMAGSGLTTALCTVAESARRAGTPVLVLADDPADAWAQIVTVLARGPAAAGGLVLADDLDALLARCDPDTRHEFADLLAQLLRAAPARGPVLVASARRLAAPLATMAGSFGSRLLLRQASREEHALAGGEPGRFDPSAAPGSGTWHGEVVQVARVVGQGLPTPEVPDPVAVDPAAHPVLAIVAARPGRVAEGLGADIRVLAVGSDDVPTALDDPTAGPTVLLGDPDAWQTDWSLLTRARREWPILLIGCAAADVRSLVRSREPPPPLGARSGECWLVHEGRTLRAVLLTASANESEEFGPSNR